MAWKGVRLADRVALRREGQLVRQQAHKRTSFPKRQGFKRKRARQCFVGADRVHAGKCHGTFTGYSPEKRENRRADYNENCVSVLASYDRRSRDFCCRVSVAADCVRRQPCRRAGKARERDRRWRRSKRRFVAVHTTQPRTIQTSGIYAAALA